MVENPGMDACLAVHKLHLFEYWSVDITQFFLYTPVIVGENAGIDDEKAVATY